MSTRAPESPSVLFDPKQAKRLHSEVACALRVRKQVHFARYFWRAVETRPYIHNWHIDCIADHLNAVLDRDVKRLIINMPPRHMKSLNVSVMFPAWAWLQEPWTRFLYSSYSQTLSSRDSVATRNIVKHPDWKELMKWSLEHGFVRMDKLPETDHMGLPFEYPEDFYLVGDVNRVNRFVNNWNGYRLATSVGGANTGEGGDIIVVDDPHNVVEGESEANRNSCLRWWDESMSTRLNDAKTGAMIIVQQRVHEEDLSGHMMNGELSDEWCKLILPASYEVKRDQVTFSSHLDKWREDPRTEEGEPLWEARYDREGLRKLSIQLGPYAAAGQLQQRPAPREGGMFKPDNVQIVLSVPEAKLLTRLARYWDKAGTEGAGCATAGILMGMMKDGRPIILDCVKGHWSAGKRERTILQNAQMDGRGVKVYFEQEPGSGGKESAESTQRMLIRAGFKAYPDKVTGSKETRAEPFAVRMELENEVLMVKAEWNKSLLEELRNFPVGASKDSVDAASGAYNKLYGGKRKLRAL